MDLRSQVFSGFRWTATARLLSQVISWAVTLLVIRILTPADYGLLAMATAVIVFLQVFAELGLGPALVQHPNLDQPVLRRALGLILVINTFLTMGLWAAAPFVAGYYGEPSVTPVLRALSLQFIIGAFGVIPNVLLMRKMEFRKRSLLDLSAALLGSLTTLGMAIMGAGVWALVAGAFVNQIWHTAGLNWLAPSLHWPDFSLKGMRPVLRFGGHVTLAGMFGTIFAQSDTIVGAKVLGSELFGFYSVGVQLAAMPGQKINGLINGVAFPAFSSMQGDVRRVGDNVLLGIRVLSFFAFPALWGIASVAPEFSEVVLGPKWTLATFPLQVLALVIPLRIIGNFVGTAAQGMGRADVVLRQTIWALLIGPALLFSGATFGGLSGLAAVWLLISPLLFVPFMFRCAPVVGLSPRKIFLAIGPAGGAGLLMCGAVTAMREVLPITASAALHLGILVAVGAVAYLGASAVMNRRGGIEALDVVRSIANSRSATV